MKFREIRATAFGPFRNATLPLGPGMNVVHGPNEAGKSSWFAATYAGLAGRRRTKGRGTAVQAEFSRRHKPWSGSLWSAGVTVTMDDGLVLAIEHNLGKGESRIVDSSTGQVVPEAQLAERFGVDLINEGTLDGTRLLGLNRDSVRATMFTGQADMLRVLSDAGQLQEFLERAATTTDVTDSTAEGALDWLARRKSELVGSASVGNRPLRARTAAQAAARESSRERRDALNELVGVIVEGRGMDEQMAKAKAEVETVERYEVWLELREERERLVQAQQLAAQVAELGEHGEGVDEERVQDAAKVLGAFESGTDPKPLADGPAAVEIAAELATLPDVPVGDLEPRSEILAARQSLERAVTALKTHTDATPADASALPATALGADALRSLAAILEAPGPVLDPTRDQELAALLAAQSDSRGRYQAEQAAYEASIGRNEARRIEHEQALAEHDRAISAQERARAEAAVAAQAKQAATQSRSNLALGLGGLLLLVGAAVAALVMPVAGVGIAVLGAAGLVAGLAMRSSGGSGAHASRAGTVMTPPAPQVPAMEAVAAPAPPPLDPRVQNLQVQIRADESALDLHRGRASEARARIEAEGITADPGALRALARTLDDADAASERRRAHSEHGQSFVEARDLAVKHLAGHLAQVGQPDAREIADPQVLLARVDAYEEACREHAEIAVRARRRTDLTAALEQRQQLELAHARAVADRSAQSQALVSFASGLPSADGNEGADQKSDVDAAALVRVWIQRQQDGRSSHGARAELVARLDQLLEGEALPLRQARLDERAASLGAEPDDLPEDLAAYKARVTTRHRAVLSRAGELQGQQQQLTQALGSVAGAAEDEAAAERDLAEVQSLEACIAAATDQLQRARDTAHANIAPALEAKIRPWLPRITGGRYLDVMVDPADLTVKVTEASGAARKAHLLSQGTMEQIFLILRIALAQVLSGDGETSPLVLDDVTVQSDAARTAAILDMLHALSQDHQVVLFTQEQVVIDWAGTNLVDGERDRVVELAGPDQR